MAVVAVVALVRVASSASVVAVVHKLLHDAQMLFAFLLVFFGLRAARLLEELKVRSEPGREGTDGVLGHTHVRQAKTSRTIVVQFSTVD